MRAIQISDAVNLAIHSMVIIGSSTERKWKTQEIADQLEASMHHLAKIHTRLGKAGLLNSARGPHGGLSLARPPDQIMLLDIYRVVEGEPNLNKCLFGKPVCGRGKCIFGTLIGDINSRVIGYFEQTSISDLLG